MAPDHKAILAERKQLLDDLAVRDRQAYLEEERREKLENMRLGFKVAMSPPGHVARAERLS